MPTGLRPAKQPGSTLTVRGAAATDTGTTHATLRSLVNVLYHLAQLSSGSAPGAGIIRHGPVSTRTTTGSQANADGSMSHIVQRVRQGRAVAALTPARPAPGLATIRLVVSLGLPSVLRRTGRLQSAGP